MNPREGSLLGPTRLQNPENPALNLSLLALIRLQGRVEIFLKPAVSISRLHPSGGGIGILLVGRSSLSWESPVPGFRYRPLYVKLEYGFCSSWPQFGHTPPVCGLRNTEIPSCDSRGCAVGAAVCLRATGISPFALVEQRRYLERGSSRGEIVWLKEGVVNAAPDYCTLRKKSAARR